MSDYQAERKLRLSGLPREIIAVKMRARQPVVSEFTCVICTEPLRGYKYEEVVIDGDLSFVCPYCHAIRKRLIELAGPAFFKLVSVSLSARNDSYKLVEETQYTQAVRVDENFNQEIALYDHTNKRWADQEAYEKRMASVPSPFSELRAKD